MSPLSIFESFGVFGLASVIFIETGFLPAFFLPGDTLLFSAGYFINRGDMTMSYAILILGLAAFLGNILGYIFGYFAEERIERYVKKHEERLSPSFLKTKRFFAKYGALTLIIARFIPLIRSVAPFLAGVTKMKKIPFLIISLISGFIWVIVGLSLGNFFGQSMPNIDYFVTGIMVLAVIVAIWPILWPTVKNIL